VVLACLRDLTPEDRVVYGPWIREASHD
jgi:hypothetical protein